jgi:N-acetylglucosamine-6-phosphate deacetylase
MIIKNIKIVTLNEVIENGYIEVKDGLISNIGSGEYIGNEDAIDGLGKLAMPGFIDIHTHGSCGIDFMDAVEGDYKQIEEAFYEEGITSFLATTLTSDLDSMKRVCQTVNNVKNDIPSLLGVHLEGPYINKIYKGAQNEAFIREPNVDELKELIEVSNGNIRLITMAPEVNGSLEFIKYATENEVTISAGHSNATFDDIENAIKAGLTNITHTHNAMSKHDHRNPGIVTASFYFDELYTECICDGIHVCPNTLKTFYKIVGPDRFMIVTDALLGKHSKVDKFQLFNLDCTYRNGAFYLVEAGNLAGSALYMNQGLKNVRNYCGASLIELAKVSSYNQAKSLHLNDRGLLEAGKLADIVLLDEELNVKNVFKLGKEVYKA